jgi:hypothetical protein
MTVDIPAPPLIVWLITIFLLAFCGVGAVVYHLLVGDMFLLLSVDMRSLMYVV